MRSRQPHASLGPRDRDRLRRLGGFQLTLLRFALTRFPQAKRVVYSTCSLEPEENEEVVQAALESRYHNFRLVSAAERLPQWTNFGSEDFECGPKCVYADPDTDLTNGFFVAVFERADPAEEGSFDQQGTHEVRGKRKASRDDEGGRKRMKAAVSEEYKEDFAQQREVCLDQQSPVERSKKRKSDNVKRWEDKCLKNVVSDDCKEDILLQGPLNDSLHEHYCDKTPKQDIGLSNNKTKAIFTSKQSEFYENPNDVSVKKHKSRKSLPKDKPVVLKEIRDNKSEGLKFISKKKSASLKKRIRQKKLKKKLIIGDSVMSVKK